MTRGIKDCTAHRALGIDRPLLEPAPDQTEPRPPGSRFSIAKTKGTHDVHPARARITELSKCVSFLSMLMQDSAPTLHCIVEAYFLTKTMRLSCVLLTAVVCLQAATARLPIRVFSARMRDRVEIA